MLHRIATSLPAMLLGLLVFHWPPECRADGVRFTDEGLDAEHLRIALTAEQRRLVEESPEVVLRIEDAVWPAVKRIQLALTARQQNEVQQRFGREVRWVEAMSRPLLENDCSCGLYNLSVLNTDSIDLLRHTIAPDALSRDELRRFGESFPSIEPPPTYACHELFEMEESLTLPEIVSKIVERAGPAWSGLPTNLPDRQLPSHGAEIVLPSGWKPVNVEGSPRPLALADLGPPIPPEDLEPDWPLQPQGVLWADLSNLVIKPAASMERIQWPTAAVRSEGEETWLAYPVVSGFHPARRSWIVSRHRNGRLQDAVEIPASSSTSDWTDLALLWNSRNSALVAIISGTETRMRAVVHECAW